MYTYMSLGQRQPKQITSPHGLDVEERCFFSVFFYYYFRGLFGFLFQSSSTFPFFSRIVIYKHKCYLIVVDNYNIFLHCLNLGSDQKRKKSGGVD